MPNCSTIRDGVWITKQNAFAAAQAAQADAQRIASIAGQYDFARDEAQCFFTASGIPVQMAMALTDKVAGHTCTVITKIDDHGDWFWLVTDMRGCRHAASELIEVVRQRIGHKLSAHFTGKANTGRAH